MHSAVPQKLGEPWATSGVPLQGIPMRLQQVYGVLVPAARQATTPAGQRQGIECCGARNSALEAVHRALVGANMSL